jgi:hypothetical protein
MLQRGAATPFTQPRGKEKRKGSYEPLAKPPYSIIKNREIRLGKLVEGDTVRLYARC